MSQEVCRVLPIRFGLLGYSENQNGWGDHFDQAPNHSKKGGEKMIFQGEKESRRGNRKVVMTHLGSDNWKVALLEGGAFKKEKDFSNYFEAEEFFHYMEVKHLL